MRRIALVAALTILPSVGFAQQTPEMMGSTPSPPTVGVAAPAPGTSPNPEIVPQVGSPLLPGSQTGRDIVADDGVSTKTVKAAPCSVAAKETDGSTTCIGLPDGPKRNR
jgi:hypothetical protein